MAESKLTDISGIGPATAKILAENGFPTVTSVAGATPEALVKVPGFGPVRAAEAIRAAQSAQTAGDTIKAEVSPEKDKKKDKKGKKKKDKKGKKKKKKDKKGKKKKDGKKKRKK